jgi:hypothetical protein
VLIKTNVLERSEGEERTRNGRNQHRQRDTRLALGQSYPASLDTAEWWPLLSTSSNTNRQNQLTPETDRGLNNHYQNSYQQDMGWSGMAGRADHQLVRQLYGADGKVIRGIIRPGVCRCRKDRFQAACGGFGREEMGVFSWDANKEEEI